MYLKTKIIKNFIKNRQKERKKEKKEKKIKNSSIKSIKTIKKNIYIHIFFFIYMEEIKLNVKYSTSESEKCIKCICISDTHGELENLEVLNADIFIYAGDFM